MIALAEAKVKEPYEFTGAYAGCYRDGLAAMDKRHVFLLHEILLAWPFKWVVELGSFAGASSTAFVEAINRGASLTATFSEVSIQDSLVDVLKNCKDMSRIRLTRMPSWMVLDTDEPFDFVFVDAAHDMDTVSLEVKKLLRRRPLCVMAHDTSSTDNGHSKCEGAKFLADTFRSQSDYLCLEDNRRRAGERTERGLFFATKDKGLFEIAKGIYDKYA